MLLHLILPLLPLSGRVWALRFPFSLSVACLVGWFVLLLVRKEVLMTSLCERKILLRLEIYDRLQQATAK